MQLSKLGGVVTPTSLVSADCPLSAVNPLGMFRRSYATSLGSDNAPTKVVQLGDQFGCEARPSVVLFFRQFVDFPSHVFGNGERDVVAVAPLPVLWDTIEQEVGDLAGVIATTDPVKCLPLVAGE
jgi:hypothetical protein